MVDSGVIVSKNGEQRPAEYREDVYKRQSQETVDAAYEKFYGTGEAASAE